MGDAESTNKIAADDCADCEDDQPTSAVACCENCAKCMCAKHVEVHSKLKSCRHHVVVPITGTKKAPVIKMAPAMCAEHPKQELIGCCRNCNKAPVCTLCLFGAHNAHKVCPLQQRPRMRIVSIQLSQYPQGLPIFRSDGRGQHVSEGRRGSALRTCWYSQHRADQG